MDITGVKEGGMKEEALNEIAVLKSKRVAAGPAQGLAIHRSAPSKNKASRFKGVKCAPNAPGLWHARIKEPGERWQTHLGTFATEEAAASAYNIAARAIWGEQAYQNVVA